MRASSTSIASELNKLPKESKSRSVNRENIKRLNLLLCKVAEPWPKFLVILHHSCLSEEDGLISEHITISLRLISMSENLVSNGTAKKRETFKGQWTFDRNHGKQREGREKGRPSLAHASSSEGLEPEDWPDSVVIGVHFRKLSENDSTPIFFVFLSSKEWTFFVYSYNRFGYGPL